MGDHTGLSVPRDKEMYKRLSDGACLVEQFIEGVFVAVTSDSAQIESDLLQAARGDQAVGQGHEGRVRVCRVILEPLIQRDGKEEQLVGAVAQL